MTSFWFFSAFVVLLLLLHYLGNHELGPVGKWIAGKDVLPRTIIVTRKGHESVIV